MPVTFDCAKFFEYHDPNNEHGYLYCDIIILN